MIRCRSADVAAPAKINLGLEILGRRPDGFHEIRSVLAMVELHDDLSFVSVPGRENSTISGVAGVAPEDNLIKRSISLFHERIAGDGYDVQVTKRIPAPAGLGGASANAAATLLALNAMHGVPLPSAALSQIAASLGSDVPFFLGSPAALARGTGIDLCALPPPSGWVLIVVPTLDLPAKTATLYGLLEPGDFSDGSIAERIADHLQAHEAIPPHMLSNAFERPLRMVAPSIIDVRARMTEAGCPRVALSGAGPAHYSLFGSTEAVRAAASRLSPTLLPGERMFTTAFRTAALTVKCM